MADRPVDSDAHVSRRVRRQRRARRRWRSTASIVALIAVLVGFALVITETVRFGGSDSPSLAQTTDTTKAGSTGSTTTTTLAGRPCRAPLTDAAPLRLWMGGDSLAGSLGPALGTIAGNTGVVQPQFDSRVSSGLTNPTFFNWPDHATKEMSRLDPEIAVFIIGANDFGAPLNTTNGADGQAAWKASYTAAIESMLTSFAAEARTVVWISSPPFKDDRNEQIKELDDLTKSVIEEHKNVAFVDGYALFSDADGKYAASLPPLDDPNGDPVPLRAGDGVHLTAQGGERLAKAVYAVIDAQCKVTAQAVPGVVKTTLQTEGSTQVAGGTSRGGTVQTTPPATTPPATSPPATSPPATSPPQDTTATTSPPATTTPTVTEPGTVPK